MVRAMKDSGVEWIGQIPEEWGTPKIVNQFDIIGSGTTPKSNENGYYENGTIYWIQSGDLHNRFLESTNRKITKEAFEDSSALKLYEPDYLVIAMYGASIGNISISKIRACTNQACCVLANSRNYLKYMYYAISSAKDYLIYSAIGGTQPNISQNIIRDLRTPMPALSEQRKIVDFLDDRIGEIDVIISKTKESIDEYKRYRNSVISEKIIFGMDSSVPIKKSGVEWCPQIPKHWNVINPKALFALRKEKAKEGDKQLTASQKKGIIYQDEYMKAEGARVVVVQKDFDILKHVEPDDFVISMRSFQGGLEYSKLRGCISSAYVMLIPNKDKVYSPFYKWFFKSSKYINAIQSTSNLVRDGQAMRYSNFAQVPLLDIPLYEQKEIANYLDAKCTEIDTLIAKKESFVEEMEAYKKSLIYEYVTGKKEVI